MTSRRKFIQQSALAITALTIPFSLTSFAKNRKMTNYKKFDVIIIGGSYSGLSAAMSLGRALRNILIIDSGKPCNFQTAHSHNFITQDGKTPNEITTIAKQQVAKYTSVHFYDGKATMGKKTKNGFEITTDNNNTFTAKKLIFATGVKDIMPDIKGFSECWGISIIHCPYCHGYEYNNDKTGILANGDVAFELGKLINNWTKNLVVFTNGTSTLSEEQLLKLTKHNIKIIEKEIDYFSHSTGNIEAVVFKDGTTETIQALYARPKFIQHCEIPAMLHCEFTENNHIKIDAFQKTSQNGIFACGDNSSMMRSVSYAVAMGGVAGAMANRELIEEEF